MAYMYNKLQCSTQQSSRIYTQITGIAEQRKESPWKTLSILHLKLIDIHHDISKASVTAAFI